MKRKLLIIGLLLLCFTGTFAQDNSGNKRAAGAILEGFVVNSSGNYIENSIISLTYSVGELAVTSIGNTRNILTQGFLQGYYIISSIDEKVSDNIPEIYPNPFQNRLFFKTESPLQIEMFDLTGHKVHSATQVSQSVDLSFLRSGIYIMKIYQNQKKEVKSIKIAKI